MSASSFADPDLLRRVQALELRAREVAEGVLLGIHHAPSRGRSIEFAEHKEYTPGDDIKRIDWKVFGKSDRYYVKEFEDDTNINSAIMLDLSASMDYRSKTARDSGGEPVPAKLDHARVMACALAYLLLNQSDAVGAGFFADKLLEFLPPRARKAHFHEISRKAAAAVTQKGTDIPAALSGLASMLRGRALVIIFSDFLDEPGPLFKAIRLLRGRRHELAIFHVLDPDEIEFPFDRLTVFEDMEGPERLLADPRSIRDEYRRHFSAFLEEFGRQCAGHGIDYRLARTDQDPADILTSWLAMRLAAMKPRGG